MSRMLVICLGSLMAATPLLTQAKVYQCTTNGKVTFSDIPCGYGMKPMELEVYMPPAESVAKAKKQTQDMEQNLATSQKQHQIDVLHREIETKKQKMEQELGALKSKKAQATNNQVATIDTQT